MQCADAALQASKARTELVLALKEYRNNIPQPTQLLAVAEEVLSSILSSPEQRGPAPREESSALAPFYSPGELIYDVVRVCLLRYSTLQMLCSPLTASRFGGVSSAGALLLGG